MKFYTVRLSLCDDNYRSNWPDFISDEEVRALADAYAKEGLLDAFYREFRNIPIARETASFKPEYFKYYDETEEQLTRHPHCESVVLVDPAKTVQMQSAFSAIVGVTVNVVSNAIYVRDIVAARLFPDQLYDATIKMATSLHASAIGVEVTSLNEFITYPFKNAISKSGRFVQLVELHARKSKEERIAALVPFYRKGEVLHNKTCCGPLETQLLWFPKSKRMDIMDALAYIVIMLEEGERYFQPTLKQTEDEFKGLVYDDPLPAGYGRVT